MAGTFERGFDKAIDINIKQPFGRIKNAVKGQKDFVGGVSTGVGEFVKEAALLPFQNIGVISSYALKKMAGVLGGTMKLGLQGLSLIPLPLPGGKNGTSIADLRGRATAFREAIDVKAHGSPEKFADILARIRGVRDDAAKRATGNTQAA